VSDDTDIVLNRDYYLSAPLTYSPLQYPYPLGGSQTPPPPPTGLHVMLPL
jgi:hypothetical protein